MRTVWAVIILIALLLPYSAVHADDSIGRIGAGGITFLKSADIRMVQEDLKISPKRIYVRYRFINERGKDILETVVFPMPPYGWNPGVSSYDQEGPLESFSVTVDGREMKTEKTRRAFLYKKVNFKDILEKDITKELKEAGLSDKQVFDTFADSDVSRENINTLNEKQKEKLSKIGALHNESPRWKVVETAHWKQLFPVKKEIEIEHSYKPFVGNSYSVPYQGKFGFVGDDPTTGRNDPKEACVSKGIKKVIDQKIRSMVKEGVSDVYVWLDEVEFILSTGRNWKGPIGNFTLTIEKESPDQIVSVCFPGKPKEINPKTLEFSQKNYVTPDKLVVYFYTVAKSGSR